jgi:tripeptide aminopeptidase
MKAAERLLNYVKIYTTSDDSSDTVPTASRELILANQLADEMKAIGIQNVRVDSTGYVYGFLPATAGCEQTPALGFISHMDTAPDFNGENVHPQVIQNYDGGKVKLGTSGRILSPSAFPELPKLAGKTLITTDGTTLLGADDKAGIAEILTACETVMKENIPHGRICIGFTPDEEVGKGASHFDIPGFGAEFAYTVDGGGAGEVSYENFNAAGVKLTIHGFNVHPGDAKNTMKNASLIAMEANAMLPAAETPANTEDREGFFHLCSMRGNIEEAQLEYIIRDHSKEHFAARKETVKHLVKVLNEKYGSGTVELELADQYENMYEYVKPYPQLIENVREVMKQLHVTPNELPIRGGTDGAMLSKKGLPCPNLGTGGYAFHGPYEHITVEDMDTCTNILVGIMKQFTK